MFKRLSEWRQRQLLIVVLAIPLVLTMPLREGFCSDGPRVKWVDDGDTILLDTGERVRYIGINAPEVAHQDRGGTGMLAAEPYGDTAAQRNRQLVKNKIVRLELDKEIRDRYGRTLAYVFTKEGLLVNEQLLLEGLAYCLFLPPNDRYRDRFFEAQRAAMKAGKGMWRDWAEPPGGPYIGNRRSKRFHVASCPYGRKTGKRNRVTLNSRWEAFLQGFAPAKKCLGKGASDHGN